MHNIKHLAIAAVGSVTLLLNSIYLPSYENNFDINKTSFPTQAEAFNYTENSDSDNTSVSLKYDYISSGLNTGKTTDRPNTGNLLVNDNFGNTAIKFYTVTTAGEDKLPLIYDSTKVDYMSYIPKPVSSDNIEAALDIDNPRLKISAPTAILFDAGTGEVLYYKNPVTAVFPASTAKLLSVLVALDWCKKEEQITVGNEITLIAPDSSKASLKKGEVITAYTLMEAMLLPSGNDAAYVMAAYVGRKSLQNPKAKNIDAVREFVNLMNEKAKELGAENSCFVTPDGYDAIGQYTTAYDMGLIGVAAVNSWTIQSIAKLCTAKKTLISGEKYIWNNTNALIKKDSKWYYPNAVGLKTGSTTMAGGCLISAARNGDDVVVSVIMNSAGDGRWTDSIKLLKYGLNKLDSGYSFK
jgi:D-alanyl-D-alanine carboxypeptidase (penicillin-binding protein 5/6)